MTIDSIVRREKTVLSIFGTRPEAIKMAPVVQELQALAGIGCKVCVTGQHRELVDQTLDLFGIESDYDLEIEGDNHNLFETTTDSLTNLREILLDARPDLVLVHGDSTTAMASAMAAFYMRIPVGHIEAGLRTFDKVTPFPEEFNRRTVSMLADLHFAPTARARQNLIAEKKAPDMITVTGNTVVDAVRWIDARREDFPMLRQRFGDRPLILVSAHRRENFGRPMERICETIRTFALQNPGVNLIYLVNSNPNVTRPAREILGELRNVFLIPPVDYTQMVFLMRQCQFIVTDSGGIQEEAPTFGKPVVVLRDLTERPEAIESGNAVLVGSDPEKILMVMAALANKHSEAYERMSHGANPFGDGRAAARIASRVQRDLIPDALVTEKRVL
jgi:UDP-N-acetylglucosamine 2-epimerase (non-hydrolysing)